MSRLIIPITTARGMGALPCMLEEMASTRALHRVFAGERLPLELIENRSMQLPQKSLVALFEGAARAAGDRLFGFRVGQSMLPGDYGLWMRFSAGGRTLTEALERCVRSMGVHQSVAHMSLRKAGSVVIWTYHPPPAPEHSGVQHSDHIIPLMIRFVQSYLGPDWNPSWIQLDYPDTMADRRLEDGVQSSVRYGGDGVSIAIPTKCMQISRPDNLQNQAQSVTSADILAERIKNETGDLVHCIDAVIALQLLEGRTGIDDTAIIVGTSIRTLQRAIHDAGSSYRRLLGAARLKRALALLRETDSSITDISFSLGYSDPANFTRAFLRLFGQPPNSLRRSQKP